MQKRFVLLRAVALRTVSRIELQAAYWRRFAGIGALPDGPVGAGSTLSAAPSGAISREWKEKRPIGLVPYRASRRNDNASFLGC